MEAGELVVSASPGAGRGLFAKRAVFAGEAALADAAVCWAPCAGEELATCAWCLAKPSGSGNSKRVVVPCVAGCGAAAFCATGDCTALASARWHAAECGVLRALRSAAPRPPPSALLVARLLREDDGRDALAALSGREHKDALLGGQRAEALRMLRTAARPLVEAAGAPWPAREEDALDALAVLHVNSLTVVDACGRVAGSALFANASLANHSCAPQCAFVFDVSPGETAPPTARLVALRDVAPGEELRVSYVELAREPSERKDELASRYCFRCACARCRAAPGSPLALADESLAGGARCESEGCVLPVSLDPVGAAAGRGLRCRCGSTRGPDAAAALAGRLEESDADEAAGTVEALRRCAETRAELLHPAAAATAQAWYALAGAEEEEEAAQRALDRAEQARLSGCVATYAPTHPALGVQHLDVAKGALLRGDAAAALHHAREASRILRPLHPRDERLAATLADLGVPATG